MVKGDAEKPNKISRNLGESLLLTPDEVKYRNKYLPDPTTLSDEKLVCTVCQVPLAHLVNDGNDIFVHIVLHVLICQKCYDFYGDGNFSVDEDGDDKYCRWCGQGGTLYLCSECSCGFCSSCARKNLKPSALAALENDDWKCFVCVPRPIYGSRTICWAAQELNKLGKERKRLKLQAQKKKLNEIQERLTISPKPRLTRNSLTRDMKNTASSKKRKHDDEDSDNDSSDSVFVPSKKPKHKTVNGNGMNGILRKTKKHKEHSAIDTETSEEEKCSKHHKSKTIQHESLTSSSDVDSSEKLKKHRKHKSSLHESVTSSSENNSKTRYKKHKKKHQKHKKRKKLSGSSADESTNDDRKEKKKKKKKMKYSSDESAYNNKKKNEYSKDGAEISADNYEEKKNNKLKFSSVVSTDVDNKLNVKQNSISEEHDSSVNNSVQNKITRILKTEECTSDSTNSDSHNEESIKKLKKIKDMVSNDDLYKEDIPKLEKNCAEEKSSEEFDQELNCNNTEKQLKSMNSEPNLKLVDSTCIPDDTKMKLAGIETLVGVLEEDNIEGGVALSNLHLTLQESVSNNGQNNVSIVDENMEKKVKLAMIWLSRIVDDISEVGSLIAVRALKFGDRKINEDNLNSYDDVLDTLNKLKQLINGVHSNYGQIEDSLEAHLKPWKVLAGLEEPESKTMEKVETSQANNLSEDMFKEKDVSNVTVNGDGDLDKSLSKVNSSSKCPETEPEDAPTDKNDDIEKTQDNGREKVLNNTEVSSAPTELYSEKNKDVDTTIISAIEGVTDDRSVVENHESFKASDRETIPLQKQYNEINKALNQEIVIEEKEGETTTHLEEKEEDAIKASVKEKEGEINVTIDEKAVEESEASNLKIELDKNSDVSETLTNDLEKAHNKDLEESVVDDKDKAPLTSVQEDPEDRSADVKEDRSNSPVVQKDSIVDIDTENNEALQFLLYSSTEDETNSTESDSDESEEIMLDDSDLDIKKPIKPLLRKKTVRAKKKEYISQDKNQKKTENEENEDAPKKETKKEEKLDSEAEIDMLTDLSKLKKKTWSRKLLPDDSSEDDSENDTSEGDNESEGNKDKNRNSRKGRKYNNEYKKRREEERNELFGFLGGSDSEGERDVTKEDLDVLQEQYGSSSSESISLEAFSQKMNAKWKELEKQQEEMNLQILLASESEEGSVGGDDLVLESDNDKKKKAKPKIKEETNQEDEANKEKKGEEEAEVAIEEEKDLKKAEDIDEGNIKTEPDEEYEKFLVGITSTRPTFKGLGSSSEELNDDEDDEDDNIDIKEELLSDEIKVKKELKDSGTGLDSDSFTSGDIFLDKCKKKSMKKKSWRNHRLLRIKLSDTDTSDEERWWQRRLEKEQKKKENQGDRHNKPRATPKKKADNSSDKEKKKLKNEKVEDGSSSTLELSSTESSGSSAFKKKSKKKGRTSDSDIMFLSDEDNHKKRRKKKKRGVGDSSDESDSGDNAMDVSQKSTQGESPGKGGRKNIRKVKTKHELAAATKAAAKEEEERKKRIAARQKLFNEMFEIKEAETLQKLVLDFDPETKTELISVDQDLVIKMKPHQAKGVKFMWDSCFESLSQLKTKKGSGCILAHCMGLGKTFQVISLVHTILKHKDTNVKTVLVVCPLSTVLNWYGEFAKWLDDVDGGKDIKVYHLTKFKRPHERSRQLNLWHKTGGVLVLGYEMFRNLTNESSKKFRLLHKESFQNTLIDPGADLVVCDEGHMLKNESTALSKAMSKIKTLRRIVLTGTPMQNNLKEYHCMVQFVKPNLLGTRKEFLNQFVNPITNGQFVDSTESDVKVMKRRAHVLHKMLEGLVQRFDYRVLTPFLPPKHEYVISLRLSEIQVKLYQFYLDHFSQRSNNKETVHSSGSQLFMDWQCLGRIWTHPRVLKMSTDKFNKEREAQKLEESEESEGSIKNFIDDKSSSLSLSSTHSSSSDDDSENKEVKEKKKKKHSKKENLKVGAEKNAIANDIVPDVVETEINLISSEDEDNVKIAENKEITELEENDKVNQTNKEEANIVEDGDQNDTIRGEGGNNEDKPRDKDETQIQKENKEKEDKNGTQEKQEKEDKTDDSTKNKYKDMDRRGSWWKDIVEPEQLEDINQSAKLILLFAILRECEMIEDKVLVFSQSLFSLDLIEYFLDKIDQATEENRLDESLGNHAGCWTKGLDYFRLDGSSSSENRALWCKSFNREDNPRARLFLISTRAGGLGINLTAANRVIIFDASWNPSHDVQSIFRIYRFGQKKPCYVYRFIAHGTMEEKVYDRQVAKQSLSSRVVDEQQVHRHFSMNDLNELYTFTPPSNEDRPTPALPKDRLMAELLTQYNSWIEKYHEHDSLLENVVEEELNEEERKLAWEDYENDKMRQVLPPPGTSNVPWGMNNMMASQLELFRKSLRIKYPNATEQEMNAMLQTLMYQINTTNQAISNQQFAAGQQTPQAQQGMSTSKPSVPQNYRMQQNSNLTPQHMFNLQRNHLYQKFGQMAHSNSGTRMGNAQIKQNQKVGNMNATTGPGYFDQMRIQQQAELARIQKQKNLQQAAAAKVLKPQISVLPKNQSLQQKMVQRGQELNKYTIRNHPKPQNPTLQKQLSLPVAAQQLNNNYFQNNQQPDRNREIDNRNRRSQIAGGSAQPTRTWKQPQQLIQNRTQLHMNSNRIQKPTQTVQKTPQQLQQEEMRRRISALQQQKQMTLQQKMQQNYHNNAADSSLQKKKLEEMKKRYAASRKNMSSAVSVVEIDDEPSRPSSSSLI